VQKLRIFAASPSDTATERAKIETVAAMLKPLADNLGIVLDVSDWRSAVPNMGRPEQVILDQLEPTEWDVLICILWHRFGTPPGARKPATQAEYSGGTEEEFKTAYNLWKQSGRPRIMMYRCMRAIPPDALDPDQFKRVHEFFKQFEAVKGEHPGLYQTFDNAEAFEKLLLNNLQTLLLDYGERLRGAPVSPEIVRAHAPRVPDNLPRRAPFFGRDKDLGTALHALSPEDRTWGVLVDGIGGIGKTALAVEAAYRCKEKGQFDAFVFVSAKLDRLDPDGIRTLTASARTLDEFLNETARILGQPGIAQLAGDARRQALLDALRSTRTLLVYDNLETLSKEEQEAMAVWLRELPQDCKAIVTSRRRGGEGGMWLRLEKLEWDAARAIIENEMKRDAQLATKLNRAGAARWSELYDETKGSPLALMHVLGLLRVRAALTFEGALDLLRGNRDPDLQKFIFQQARRELTVNDEAALRALSLFTPSAAFDSWAEVATLSRNALETTIDRLSALSLVDVLAGEERYALHPLTRNFVRDELLAELNVAQDTGMRFARYWVAFARRNGGVVESYKTVNLLEAEWPNLEAAAEWLWQRAAVRGATVGDQQAARMLNDVVSALREFLWFGGRWDERVHLNSRAYKAMRATNEWSNAGWRAYDAAWTYSGFARNLPDESSFWIERAVEAWAHGGSKYEQAAGTRIRGLTARQREKYDDAEQFLQESLAILRELKYERPIAVVLSDLGNVRLVRGQYDEADQYFREALTLDERSQNKEGMATRYGCLGLVARQREQWAEAREWHDKELSLGREIGRQDLIADALYGLALVQEHEGSTDLALPLAEEALAIHERLRASELQSARQLVERLRSGGKSGEEA